MTSVTITCRRRGFGGRVPSRRKLWGFWGKPLAAERSFVRLWKNNYFNFNAIWVTFRTFLEQFERSTILRFESQLKLLIV